MHRRWCWCPLLLTVLYYQLVERKVIGWIQVRIGPNRVGRKGVLQPIADVIKLLIKEQIVPDRRVEGALLPRADRLASRRRSPRGRSFPFSPAGCSPNIDAALLLMLAMTSMGVYGVIIAGWASNSKYAFLGAMRSAAQIVSYEIAMGFALVGVLMAGQSMNLTEIVARQDNGCGLLRLVLAAAAPALLRALHRRARRDQPRALRRGRGRDRDRRGLPRRVLGDDVRGVLPRRVHEHDPDLDAVGAHLLGRLALALRLRGDPRCRPAISWLAAPSILWLLGKIAFFMFAFLWFRATFPRYRYDQIMRLGWKVFIPVTLVWIVVVGV